MKLVFICITLLISGCFTIDTLRRFDDIIQRSPSYWTNRDCLSVIVSSMVNNLSDKESNIQVIGTPYYPSVVAAINQMQRMKNQWTTEETIIHLDDLLKQGSGLYLDRKNGRYVNSRGDYFKDQTDIDSLLIAVTLRNKSFPCNVPVMNQVVGYDNSLQPIYASVPIASFADWPCYIPEIVDLESRIILLNDRGDTLKPKFVWGRKNNLLTMEETLFVMFILRTGEAHFLEGARRPMLFITGFEYDLKFTLDVSKMR